MRWPRRSASGAVAPIPAGDVLFNHGYGDRAALDAAWQRSLTMMRRLAIA